MKIFTLNYSLLDAHLTASSKYTEKGMIDVLAPDDRSARDQFLNYVNNSQGFINPSTNTFWPMPFTRLVVLSSSVKKEKDPISVSVPVAVKKERKKRTTKVVNKGIKPSNARRKKN